MERELVISRYNRDPSAIVQAIAIPTTIYNKGQFLTIDDPRVEVIDLPNLGREAGTILEHICRHYANETLADVTFFVQDDIHTTIERLRQLVTLDYDETAPLSLCYTPEWPGPEVTDHDHTETVKGFQFCYGDANYHGGRQPAENLQWLTDVWSQYFRSPKPARIWYGTGSLTGLWSSGSGSATFA